jgi:hypothetical protein
MTLGGGVSDDRTELVQSLAVALAMPADFKIGAAAVNALAKEKRN